MPAAIYPPLPKVLVPEKLSPDGLTILNSALEVHEKKGLSSSELLEVIPEYDALVIRSETKVTSAVLTAGKRLKVVARAGVGVDNVDVEAATKLGIVVVNSPSGNIGAAAEHTIALMMSMARNIPDACASLKAGKWERSKFVGVELKGKTLGIIGLGKVGLIVARAAKGLGMTVAGVDPYATQAVASAASVNLLPSLEALLPIADFLTIHTPLIASTKGMVSTAEIALMKPGSRILNVARGGTIDEAALLQSLDSGHLAGAALDVFTSEPPPSITADSEATLAKLIAHPKIVATPHLGASTREAQESVSVDVCEQVLAILSGALPRSAVNAPLILPEEYKTLQPFVQLVEKIGCLYTQHFSTAKPGAGVDVRNRSNFDLIYEGEVSAIHNTKPLFAALIKGLLSPISSEGGGNVNIVNAELIAKERGIVINEQHSRDQTDRTYSSLVTLIARSPGTSSRASSVTRSGPTKQEVHEGLHIVSGYISAGQPFISRVSQFATNFSPEGKLLICHNYDAPGKIGVVGSVLGKEGVNINFMSVASASFANENDALEATLDREKLLPKPLGPTEPAATNGSTGVKNTNEALMILGVDKEVSEGVVAELISCGGVLSVSNVTL
ncbi:MAG: hypothetical protein Q9227_002272 [Pyrenula ochraceoflavens]